MNRLARLFIPLLLATPFLASAQGNLQCSIWTDKQTYAPNDMARFQWLSIDARSASLDGVGPVALSGFWRAPVSTSGSVTLRVRGNNSAERVCSVSYTVRAQRPTCHISAIPLAVAQNSFVTVSWNTQHASSVSVSGIGQVPASGSRIVRADRSNTYTLVAVGDGGSCTMPTTVTVQSPVSAYGYFPTVVNSIADPLFGRSRSNTYDVYYYDNYYSPVYESVWYEEQYYAPEVWYEERYYSPDYRYDERYYPSGSWPGHEDEGDGEPAYFDRPLTPSEFERSWDEGGADSDNDWRDPLPEPHDDGSMPVWDRMI